MPEPEIAILGIALALRELKYTASDIADHLVGGNFHTHEQWSEIHSITLELCAEGCFKMYKFKDIHEPFLKLTLKGMWRLHADWGLDRRVGSL